MSNRIGAVALRNPAARVLALLAAMAAVAVLAWHVGSGGLNPQARGATLNGVATPASADLAVVRFIANGTVLDGGVALPTIGGNDYTAGWSDVLSMVESASAGGGDGRLTGRLVANPLVITKRLDAATPQLFEAMAQNQDMTVTVHLHGNDPNEGSTRLVLSYELTNARIVGRQVSRSADWDQYVETISIQYHIIRITNVVENTEYEWNVQANV
ncbi:MAG: type VI secretion system tube protein Hcp [SAR202 cluster bacterium]|nr:type VI secretion system tube protein Hcp [SAR202 cluster bacterium]